MTDQIDFLHLIVQRLEQAGIPYMLTGSLAMSVYTQPRMTRDIDLVVDCRSVGPDVWQGLFQDDCYVSPEAVAEAVAGEGMFNIIHLEGVAKADFIVRKSTEYRKVEFGRRQTKTIGGRDISVVAVEDLFLSKLIWWKESDSALQKADLELIRDSIPALDLGYVKKWAGRLGVLEHLKKLVP